MPVRDTFLYEGRWDSVGLDCSYCLHFIAPVAWPDEQRESQCGLHRLSLAIELGQDGFKSGEWFCADFAWNGDPRARAQARAEFEVTLPELKRDVLYGLYGSEGYLLEHEFEILRRPN